jgi:glyoxylase-like metal-dependent hydrolase (beta-lactamase superfamily II)
MFESVTETVSAFVGSALGGPPPRGLPALHPVARLSPRVVRVLGGNPGAFTLQGTNAYLIGTGPRRWLLDTGEGKPAFVANLRAAMTAEGVTELEGILLTHWHLDHVGGVAHARRLARELSANDKNEKERRPLIAYKRVRRDKNETAIDLDRLRSEPNVDARVALAETFRAYGEIRDGDVFDSVPGATLRALFTPGHTEDHVCFVLEEEGAIFAGDCVLNGNTAVFENLVAYSRSLETMRAELERAKEKALENSASADEKSSPPVGRLYPSHGDVICDGVRKLEQYARHRETRDSMFRAALIENWRSRPERGGVTISELTRSVYRDTVSPLVLFTACERIAAQHLKKLVEEGRVIREERKRRNAFFALVPRRIVELAPSLFAETRFRPAPAEMTAAT